MPVLLFAASPVHKSPVVVATEEIAVHSILVNLPVSGSMRGSALAEQDRVSLGGVGYERYVLSPTVLRGHVLSAAVGILGL